MKTVLFDLDGTLIDSITDITNAINLTMAELGCMTYTVDEVRGFVGDGARMLVKRAIPENLHENLDEILALYRKNYTEHMLDKTQPYQGIRTLITALKAKGIVLGIASNKPDTDVKKINDVLFDGKFDIALGADETKRRRKPARDIVDACLEELGGNIEDCIYVGDSHVDFETANNAGVNCILVSWGYGELQKSDKYAVVDCASELLECIMVWFYDAEVLKELKLFD